MWDVVIKLRDKDNREIEWDYKPQTLAAIQLLVIDAEVAAHHDGLTITNVVLSPCM